MPGRFPLVDAGLGALRLWWRLIGTGPERHRAVTPLARARASGVTACRVVTAYVRPWPEALPAPLKGGYVGPPSAGLLGASAAEEVSPAGPPPTEGAPGPSGPRSSCGPRYRSTSATASRPITSSAIRSFARPGVRASAWPPGRWP